MVDVYGAVNAAVRRAGGQKAFAGKCGISPQDLNAQLHARDGRGLSRTVLRGAGITVRTTTEYWIEDPAPAVGS